MKKVKQYLNKIKQKYPPLKKCTENQRDTKRPTKYMSAFVIFPRSKYSNLRPWRDAIAPLHAIPYIYINRLFCGTFS